MTRSLLITPLLLAVVAVQPAQAGYAPGGPVLVRDGQAGSFDLTPPAPTSAHPQVIQADTTIEPSITVNPNDPLNVVTGYQEGRVDGGGDETNGFATTFDGGKSWIHGEWPGLTYLVGGAVWDRASDAVVAFGPNNTVYASSLVFTDSSANGLRSGMAINVSKDGGRTWSAPVFFQDDNLGGLNDKNWVVVDNSDAPGHHKGRVYVVWDRVAPVIYNYCDSNCDTLAGWVPTFYTMYSSQGIGAYPLVLLDGSLGVVFKSTTGGLSPIGQGDQPVAPSPGSEHLVMDLAPMAGNVVWPLPLPFQQVPLGIADEQNNTVRYQRASDGIQAADVDPGTGEIVVAWDDSRYRKDAVDDIVISTSRDGGVTWSNPPIRVNQDDPNDFVNHYNAMVSITGGVIHIAYRQRQEGVASANFSPFIDTYFQQSADDGKTWTTPLKVDQTRTNFFYGAFSRAGLFQGDYNQIASGGGFTYIARMEAYPLYPGEPRGLSLQGGVYAATAEGLKHLHQRTYVAVVGPAGAAAAASASPVATAASPSPSPTLAPLPNTGAAVSGHAPWVPVGLVLLPMLAVYLGVTLRRPRRPGQIPR
ncbi:MAG: hypothetical protein ACYDGR_06605 [Candidatus Dormibacteria bacterium]